jgi:hypothetical protein
MTQHKLTTRQDQQDSDNKLFALLTYVVLIVSGVVALATYFDVLTK